MKIVCLPRKLDMKNFFSDRLFGKRDQYCGLFLRGSLVGQLKCKKMPVGLGALLFLNGRDALRGLCDKSLHVYCLQNKHSGFVRGGM